MKYRFEESIPGFDLTPILISGAESVNMSGREYLVIEQENGNQSIYEIRFTYHCSPFKEVIIADDIIAVGHEEAFYIFNTITNENIIALQTSGYFGHLYFEDGLFYVADADGLYCIDKNGGIIWRNNNLGVDGVIINNFTKDKIFGSGEWDPPGGWEDFVLDRQTGLIIDDDTK